MPRDYLKTSDIAQATGVHPNTVRLYESLGYLPPAPRTPKGYRRFTTRHLDHMRLARHALGCTWIGGEIRRTALDMLLQAAAGDFDASLENSRSLLAQVQTERNQAEAAARYLEAWARGEAVSHMGRAVHIGEAARRVHASIDQLRNWERNGLLRVPRQSSNGYRLYGAEEIGRLQVIRMLLGSGYSMMAVLRMMLQFDRGERQDLRQALDTPRPDEDMLYASDRWLTTLETMEQHACDALDLLEEMARAIEKDDGSESA